MKYLVVFRNPDEALVSFRPFLEQYSDEWFDLWQMPRAAMCRPDFPSFYSEVIDSHKMQGMLFGFLAAWWPLRREKNVLFLHYSEMKRDHEGSIRKIARCHEGWVGSQRRQIHSRKTASNSSKSSCPSPFLS